MPTDAFSIDKFYRYGKKFSVKRGEYISNPGKSRDDECAFLLDSGICALTSLSKDGKEKIFLYFSGKRIVGFTQLMPIREPSPERRECFFIQAKTACTVYRITREVFFRLLKTDPDFLSFMLRVLSENYVEILNRFSQAQEESAITRLCYLLLEQSREENGRLVFPSYFTYVELSKYLGVHPVTIARIMEKLKQSGYIAKSGSSLVVEEPKRLKELIGSGCGIDY